MEKVGKLIELLKKQIKIENEHISRLNKLQKRVDTKVAELMLIEMRLDSQKHAAICGEIIKMMEESPSKPLWERRIESFTDRYTVKNELEEHIKLEEKTLNLVNEEIKSSPDEGVKMLLQHIADDEKKHHEILETVVKYAYKIKK